ncbi:MAG: rod-binding protein [Candidatus Latescibacteria bacterium]|nr:rod-binding protein [Candidatus Latescibacterota bacterium]
METRSINVEGLNHLRDLGHAKDANQRREGLRQAAKEFESVFMYQVVKAMRATVPKDGLIEKGEGEEMFEGMLDEEWSKKLSARGGPSSLSEVLYRQLSRAAGLEEDEKAAGVPAVNTVLPTETNWRKLTPAMGTARVGKTEP